MYAKQLARTTFPRRLCDGVDGGSTMQSKQREWLLLVGAALVLICCTVQLMVESCVQ